MLKFYLASVIVWMIIIRSTMLIFKDGLNKKIVVTETKKANLFKRWGALFALSAVPVIRLIIVIILVYMAVCTQEDFDRLIKK